MRLTPQCRRPIVADDRLVDHGLALKERGAVFGDAD
jgi:hypothetical protein